MTDDDRVHALKKDIFSAVNASRLPLSIKGLALENIMLRIK